MTAGKRIAIVALALLLAVAVGGGTVVWSLLQVPDFYEEALAAHNDPGARKEAAKEFVERTVQLADEIKHSGRWSEEFTQQQINGWLAEELHQKYPELVPPGVRDPRVSLKGEAVLVGFRYESREWSGVVSLRLKPWVHEPNQLAIGVESIQAGLLPVPLDRVLEQVSRELKSESWRTEWAQVDGKDVLIVHLDDGQPDQPVLEAVRVSGGLLRISGRSPATQSDAESGDRQPHEGDTFNTPRVADQSGAK